MSFTGLQFFFYLEMTYMYVWLGHHFGPTKEKFVRTIKHKGKFERLAYKKVKFYL